MFTRALVPTDFSPAADRLLDGLDEISSLGRRDVFLIAAATPGILFVGYAFNAVL